MTVFMNETIDADEPLILNVRQTGFYRSVAFLILGLIFLPQLAIEVCNYQCSEGSIGS